jgi:tryptophan synthase alpha chain
VSRIAARFEQLARDGRKGLIPYICAGDPAVELTVPLMHALARAGSDVIELGVPFSDPMADGPVIQRATERAIQRGVGLKQTLRFVREFRRDDAVTPVVLMGYANPIERLGRAAFASEASAAGVDGVLVVDYPPEECEDFAAAMRAHEIDPIFLLAPTSTDTRIARVCRAASGFIYYVSLRGTTGAGHLDVQAVAHRIPAIKAMTPVPVGVGFGIRDAASAAALARTADAVIIGARLIEAIVAVPPADAVAAAEAFLRPIRRALDELAPQAPARHAA